MPGPDPARTDLPEGESYPAGYRRRVTQGQAATERARTLADPAAFDEIADPALRKVLRSYLQRGRLQVLPRGGTKRSLLLAYLATAFEPGVRYPETEVNEIVGVWHPDVAALRRYLVDEGLLARQDSVYWRCGGWV
ncbi:MAG: DUF2087 domain-containing protein [Actinobacteria bacterium]|nr:DUF2087 domain-containing protein [Actinomycetota bacterium]